MIQKLYSLLSLPELFDRLDATKIEKGHEKQITLDMILWSGLVSILQNAEEVSNRDNNFQHDK